MGECTQWLMNYSWLFVSVPWLPAGGGRNKDWGFQSSWSTWRDSSRGVWGPSSPIPILETLKSCMLFWIRRCYNIGGNVLWLYHSNSTFFYGVWVWKSCHTLHFIWSTGSSHFSSRSSGGFGSILPIQWWSWAQYQASVFHGGLAPQLSQQVCAGHVVLCPQLIRITWTFRMPD